MAKTNMKTGATVERGMPFADYLAVDAVSASSLKAIHQSPALFRYRKDNPPSPTPSMVLGSACHAYTLEPHTFPDDFIIAPDVNRRTNAGKEQWAQFEELAGKRTIITDDVYQTAKACRDSVLADEAAAKALDGSEREVSVFWRDEATGLRCKSRFDVLRQEAALVADVKTCADASPVAFARSVHKFGYHIQEAMYRTAYKAAFGVYPEQFLFIAVETSAPYITQVYSLCTDSVAQGYRDMKSAMALYAYCTAHDEWPGYGGGVKMLSLPRYAINLEATDE